MDVIDRLQLALPEATTIELLECMESAKTAILNRRFPFGDFPEDEDGNVLLENRYKDLQYRICIDLYNKAGAEGQLAHTENGIYRTYESSWVSDQLLREVTPFCGVTK